MSLRIVRSLDRRTWSDFVNRHPQGNIFHTPEMFEAFNQARGHSPAMWAAVGAGDEPLALFTPVLVRPEGRLARRMTARAISYGGVLGFPTPEGRRALTVLLAEYLREVGRAVVFTELRNLSDTQAVSPALADAGFAPQEHLNYLADLSLAPETLFQRIGPRTRKHIRRAIKKGEVTVREIGDRRDLSFFYDLLRRTYQAARIPLADHSLFEAAWDVLRPAGMARFVLAFVRDTPAASSVELMYKDTVYGWYGGVDRRFNSFSPNEVLTWLILDWGARQGYRWYDFGGAGRPGERYGVRDFKAKFGGERVSFGRYLYVHRPLLLRLSKLAYGIYRLPARRARENHESVS